MPIFYMSLPRLVLLLLGVCVFLGVMHDKYGWWL